jgi:AmmeMemoRadiSam system protein A
VKQHSLPVRIAKASLNYLMEHGKVLPAFQEPVPAELQQPAGVFVSLKKQGQLRGCIGTILPTQPDATSEIIQNAVSAATADPRFPRVKQQELAELEISVDILTPPEPIESLAELDPRRYGVIVRCGRRSGLLLPDLEGVDSVEEQVDIACRKAGIHPGEPLEMYRFQVIRYK